MLMAWKSREIPNELVQYFNSKITLFITIHLKWFKPFDLVYKSLNQMVRNSLELFTHFFFDYFEYKYNLLNFFPLTLDNPFVEVKAIYGLSTQI